MPRKRSKRKLDEVTETDEVKEEEEEVKAEPKRRKKNAKKTSVNRAKKKSDSMKSSSIANSADEEGSSSNNNESNESSNSSSNSNCSSSSSSSSMNNDTPSETSETKCSNNEGLFAVFDELAKFEFAHKERFKGGAYRKVATAIQGLDFQIQSGEDVKSKKGFGKAAVNKIDEWLSTGKVTRLEKYHNHYGTVENVKNCVKFVDDTKKHSSKKKK